MEYAILVFALFGLALLVDEWIAKSGRLERDCDEWPNLSDPDGRMLP